MKSEQISSSSLCREADKFKTNYGEDFSNNNISLSRQNSFLSHQPEIHNSNIVVVCL